jgi:hypothetical protein
MEACDADHQHGHPRQPVRHDLQRSKKSAADAEAASGTRSKVISNARARFFL